MELLAQHGALPAANPHGNALEEWVKHTGLTEKNRGQILDFIQNLKRQQATDGNSADALAI